MNALKPGTYHDLSINEYHSDSAVGSSTLKTIASKTPAHIHGQIRKESAAFDFGSALHLSVLEPHLSDKIIRGPDDRRGKKWSELKEECDAKNQLLLPSGDYDDVFAAKESIFKNELCASLLTGNVEPEISVFHDDIETGLRVKIRPDLYNHDANVIIDLKTCVSAAPHAVSKSIADFGYAIQNAFYERVWNESQGKEIDGFYFFFIEKSPPYSVAIFELDDASFMEGWEQMRDAMLIYKECKEKNEWPGYPETVQKIRLPSYAFKFTDPTEIPAIKAVV
jgi:hypothetical protein